MFARGRCVPRCCRIVVLCLAVFLCVKHLPAQETAGIIGRVTDPSGGYVVDAAITITNDGTGYSRTLTSGADGSYSALNLAVGYYTVGVEAEGFDKARVDRVKVDVNRLARVDVSMNLGTVTQEVRVDAPAALVNTADSQIGTLIANRAVQDLPLNGRNFLQLNVLIPGATTGSTGTYIGGFRGSGTTFSVSGQRQNFNEYLLDGMSFKQLIDGPNSFTPSVDAIEEFRLQTSNSSSEFGSQAGGQVNMVTKSGTNEIHGSLFNFLRNDILDARNFFAPSKTSLRRNQFGGTVGGPFAKDKLFGFFSYEGTRIVRGFLQRGIVPNAEQRNADFSELLNRDVGVFHPVTAEQFLNNVIPASRVSPISRKVIDEFVPLPNASAEGGINFISTDPDRIGIDQYIGRMDYNFSNSDRIFGRYVLEDLARINPKLFPTDGYTQWYRAQNVVFGHTRVLGPAVINEFRFGYNRFVENELVDNAFNRNVVEELGMSGLCEDPACWGVPQFSPTGFLYFGEHGQGQVVSGPRSYEDERYLISDSLFWIRGRHSLKAGVQLSRLVFSFPEAIFPRGLYSFDGRFTSGTGSPSADTSLADFFLGLPRTSLASIDIFDPMFRRWEIMPWIQDDIRITPDLTLNLGLRYEWYGRPISKNDTISTVDYSSSGAVLLTARNADEFGYPRSLVDNDNNNFAPRVGFAWTPTSKKDLVVRGGYGIFYQPEALNTWIDIAINPPFIRQSNYVLEPADISTYDFSRPFANAADSSLLVFSIDRKWTEGYVQQWNFNVQQQLGQGTVVQIGYVGNTANKLPRTWDTNQAFVGHGSVASRRPYADFGTINHLDDGGASNYHSLQFQLERRFSNDLGFLLAYTWAKAIDDSPGSFVGEGGTRHQDVRNMVGENRALASQDTRHRLVLSYIYELPFGRGKQFASGASSALQALVGGWRVSGIMTATTGHPFTIQMPGDWANVGSGNSRPHLVDEANLPDGERTLSRYFNTGAFIAPAAGAFGNAGRNIIMGPGGFSWDFALAKTFTFRERLNLQFRAEAFNILNHPVFNNPGSTFNSPLFGQITSAADPRILQFGLKLQF